KGSWADKITAPLYYARMSLHSGLPFFHSRQARPEFCGEYARWIRFIEASSRRLTRSSLLATLRHRQGLHHKQLLLQHLVNDSLSLFPMAATLWFASQPEMRTKPGILELASYFCQEMADHLHPPSSLAGRIRRHKKDTVVYRLSRKIMNGEYAWLEEGILPCLRNDGTARNMPL
ncbi:MAG TPA: hypothetical protein VIU63_08135, partial [Nitrospira sp.]